MEKTKRSVDIIESFCGWDYLLKLVEKCVLKRNEALISALFETGGRISEVLQLKKDSFVVQEPYVIVRAMPVLKRYKKIGEHVNKEGEKHWITEGKNGYRTFPIHMKEPLTPILMDYIQDLRSERLFDLSRIQAYRIVRGLDSNIFPHWFRAQRASQLALEYGFSVHDLIDFFSWKSLQTAVHYSRMGWKGLAAKMTL